MRTLPVTAAVINHNAAPKLESLLPQVAEAGYDDVVVLDDASRDDTRDVAKRYGIDVIGDHTERGQAGNYNRILERERCEIVHFIDADARLITPVRDAAERIRDTIPSSAFGYVGGLVLDETGVQHPWNFGPRQGLGTAVSANLQFLTAAIEKKHPSHGQVLRRGLVNFLDVWPEPRGHYRPRQVYWSMAQNMVMDTTVLREIGGFDEHLRHRSIQDLSIRLARLGMTRYFSPSIIITLGKNSPGELYGSTGRIRDEYTIARRYGLGNWLRSSDK